MENCAIPSKCYNQIDFMCTFPCNKHIVKWEGHGNDIRTRAPDLHILWYIPSVFVEYPDTRVLNTEMAGSCECYPRRADDGLLEKGINGVNDRFCTQFIYDEN